MTSIYLRKIWQLPLMVTVCALALAGCSDDTVTGTVPAADAAYYDGFWEQKGYGQYVDITPETVTRYEAATDSCIKTHSLQRNDFPGNLNWTITDSGADTLKAYMNNDVSDELILHRISALPASCDTPRGNSPTHVIDHLIAMADDYYAFFEQRNISWQDVSSQAKAAVHDEMTDQELKAVVEGLLSVFNDAHVIGYFDSIDLLDPMIDFNHFGVFVQPDNLRWQLVQEYLALSPKMSFPDYEIEQSTNYHSLVSSYMDNDLVAKGGRGNNTLKWGTINQTIGYLQVGELDSFDPEHAGDPLSEAANPVPHLAALNAVLDEVVTDLQHMSTIVLDLRLHSGGTTVLDQGIAQRFMESELTYGSFSAPGSEKVSLILQPYKGKRLHQPVVVITSGFNQSSGEELIMALKAKSDTTQIGEKTLGTFSDQLFMSLTNQWAFSPSNETWYDQNDVSWEGTGLQPDHALDVFAITDRQLGVDTAIERALTVLQ